MTRRTPFILTLIALLFAPLACAGRRPVWTITYNRAVDMRITRELKELAARNGARVCSKDAANSTHPGDLQIELDSTARAEELAVELKEAAASAAVAPTAELANEGYLLHARYSPEHRLTSIRIVAASAAGEHYALLRMPELLRLRPAELEAGLVPRPQGMRMAGDGLEATLADYPAFPVRGIVEGFYGRTWSHGDRTDVLRFEGQHALNVYYYGPKDDLYQRQLWREPYPHREMNRLAALIRTAQENFVSFSFAVSPGLSMIYSSDAEFRRLTEKFDSVEQLGARDFALFLDDVPEELVHPEDREHYRTLAAAHVDLINRLYRHLQNMAPESRLMVCPTTYTNAWGSRDYVRELGAGVGPRIDIAWSGTDVISPAITAEQAREWGELLRRKPVIWDNYFSNDERAWLLTLQPLRGRATDLASAAHGLFQNPMNQAHATLLTLETFADYAWNPAAYEPDASRAHAAASQFGTDAPRTLAPLFDLYDKGGDGVTLFPSIFDETAATVEISKIEVRTTELEHLMDMLKHQAGYAALAAEIATVPTALREQLKQILADQNFAHLADGKIQRDPARDALEATRATAGAVTDGDFAKWTTAHVYALERRVQLADGEKLWTGPSQFSARVALRWDEQHLYIGVQLTDPSLYAPASGKAIEKQDAFHLMFDVDSVEQIGHERSASVYDLYFSPGNFADIPAGVYRETEFFPSGVDSSDSVRTIRSVWKKTATGATGDIVVPAALFKDGTLTAGQRIALSFDVQKSFPHGNPLTDDPDLIRLTSKEDMLFPISSENPRALQQVILRK